jgi:protein TonB
MAGPNRSYRLQGWMVSVLVHGLALPVALGIMAQVKPVTPKEAFTWDVALVEPQRTRETSQAEMTPAQEPVKPTPRPVTPSPIQPKKVTREVQSRKVTPVVQQEIRQSVETIQPIQQIATLQPKAETVTPVMEQPPSEVQQTEQSVDESVVPVMQQEAAPQPVITETSVHPVEAPTSETAPITPNLDPPVPPVMATAAVSDAKPVVRESTQQTAMATSPTSVAKADHGWLAESLRRRLAEIKRYPSFARLNGQEGKVVLRAVIRADGHLSEVKVHRSSGHEVLDNAAVEAIRLACPLHMHQPLGAPEVAVYVPMVYSLGG